MNIIIKHSDRWTQKDWDQKEQRLGVKVRTECNNDYYLVYQIIDKHLFMLAVIKYNIEFEEI
jgi:hypothetical protein